MQTNQAVDNKNSEQADAVAILRNLKDQAFDSSDEKLAQALGRPTEEVEAWISGAEEIDDDGVIKVRGLAQERGLELQG
jgi:plasmid maintenance system antidote protein VapI